MTKELDRVKELIRVIPDFPVKGIQFQDIVPIFSDPLAVESVISTIVQHLLATYGVRGVDVVAGLDARGFLFGPMVAARLGASFVPIRKKGKLPGETFTAEYVKEYGVDIFEIQTDSIKPGQQVVVVDDLIATGGSAKAAGTLVSKAGGKTLEYVFLVELIELSGAKALDAPTYSLIKV
ncbi:adenine phosphoribosyltransferase [Ramicandelaber brevisporus]|nr:adenine phosphoribosyltransferase [Ramicandelaber brevisporus]KAI8865457.1 adenine phosphoribosyltransferase [Ramicandelaber brevisporus]